MSNGKVITIPVQFHDTAASYKTIIANLETELKKVKPGTAIYDSIADQLKKAKKLSSKIDIDLGENIHKESDISRLEKDFANLYTVIESVNKGYKELSHTDLNINTENFGQLAEDYKKIRIELEKAQKAAKEAKSTSIGDLFAGDTNALKQFNKNDLSKAGVEVFSNLTKEAQKAEVAISQAADEIEALEKKFESAKRSGTKETRFSQKIIGITKDSKATVTERRESLNAQLQSYFKKNGEWRANANSEQAEQIMRAFGMDQETINKILTTIPNRAKIIEEAVNKVTQKSFNAAHSEHYDAASKAKKEIEGITSKINKNKSIQADRQGELSGINQSLETLKTKLVNLGVVSSDGNSLSKLDKEIDELEKQVQELQAALLEKAPRAQDANIPPPTAPLSQEFDASKQAELFKDNLKGAVKQWFGLHEIINMVKNGIRQAVSDIQGLDKAMTNIAVVTDMSIGELWGKINEYMAIAKQYGVTTQGVYEVSQLYYQQGLSQAEVTELTTETLKLARVANMDYAKSADAMTVALRGFKMEMSDAARVTDVYSEVAAITASDQAELANAMSKTASSAASVGSSFENTTAMLAVMVETTRESAQNLGSALKSIISRYGEMKVGVTVDSEGEALDYNKVDTALKSVGISIKDAKGQFRDFDDVIFELSEKWDSLDKNTQRYIATIMAGNRQQSRFIALVDNWERLDEVSKAAADSQDAGLLQYAKTMDSLETKINNIKTSFQQFYMDLLNGPVIGGALEFVNKIIEGFNKVSKITTTLNLTSLIVGIKNIANILIDNMYDKFERMFKKLKEASLEAGRESMENYQRGASQVLDKKKEKKSYMDRVGTSGYSNNEWVKNWKDIDKNKDVLSRGTAFWGKTASVGGITTNVLGSQLSQLIGNAIGAGLSVWGSKVAATDQAAGAKISATGTAITSAMTITKAVASMGGALGAAAGPIGLVAGVLIGLVSYLVSVPSKLEKAQEDLANAQKEAEDANIKRAEAQKEAKDLDNTISKLKELQRVRYRSQEAEKEYMDACAAAAEQFPYLEREIDGSIDAIKNAEENELLLAEARRKAADATLDAAEAELKTAYKQKETLIEEEKEGQYNTSLETHAATNDSISSFFLGREGITKDTTISKAVEMVYNDILDIKDKEERETQLELLNRLITDHIGTIDSYSDVQDYLSKANSYNTSWQANEARIQAGQKAVIKASVESFQLGREAKELKWQEITGAQEAYLQAAYNQLKDISEYFDQETGELTSDGRAELDDIQGKLQDSFKKFYDSLGNGIKLDNFNEFYESAKKGNLSVNETLEELGKYQDIPKELRDSILLPIAEASLNLRAYLEDQSTGFDNWDILQTSNIPLMYQSYITDFNDYLKSQVKNESITPEDAQNIIKQYSSVINELYNSVPEDLQAKAQEILYTGDWTSLSGLYDMLYALKEAGITIDGIDTNFGNIIENSSYNLVTESENFLNKIATNFDNAAKAIDEAASGLDNIADVVKMANKLGLSFDDFNFEDGKFYLNDPEMAMKKTQTEFDDWKATLSSQFDNYISGIGSTKISNKDEVKNLIEAENTSDELRSALKTYGDTYVEALNSGTFTGSFNEYVTEIKNNTIEGINSVAEEYLNWYEKEAIKETESRKFDIFEKFASSLSQGLSDALSFSDVYDLGYDLQAQKGWDQTRWANFQSEHISQLPSGEFRIDFEGVAELATELDLVGAVWEDLVDSFESIEDVENMWKDLGSSIDGAAKVILKNIEAIKRADASDAMFDFMGQNMESYADTYKTMAENLDDWSGVMTEAMEKGTMGIADFWNISRVMSKSLKEDQIDAWNEYAQAVMATAKTTEGGIVAIEGTVGNFGTGLEVMKAGMQDYYKQLANEQIKVIDAQIAALKAQEAAEKAIKDGQTVSIDNLIYTGGEDTGLFTRSNVNRARDAMKISSQENEDYREMATDEEFAQLYQEVLKEALKKGLDTTSVEVQQMIHDSTLARAGLEEYSDSLKEIVDTNQILSRIDANVSAIAEKVNPEKAQSVGGGSGEKTETPDTSSQTTSNGQNDYYSTNSIYYDTIADNLGPRILEQEARIANLELDNTKLNTTVEELNTKLATYSASESSLATELLSVQEERDILKTNLIYKEEELRLANAEKEKLNKEIAQLTEQNNYLTSLHSDKVTAESDVQLALDEANDKLSSAEKTITSLNSEITSLTESIAKKDEEIANLKAIQSQNTATILSLEAQLNNANKKIAENFAMALVGAGTFDKYDEQLPEEQKAHYAQGAVKTVTNEIDAGQDVETAVKIALYDLFDEGTYESPEVVPTEDVRTFLNTFAQTGFTTIDGVATQIVQDKINAYLNPPTTDTQDSEEAGTQAAEEYTTGFEETITENPPSAPVEADITQAQEVIKTLIENINNSEAMLKVKTVFSIDSNGNIVSNKGGQFTAAQLAEIWTNIYNGSAEYAGNVSGLALYNGANFANKTLVGELGPELAVYDDMYHLLGQNGAEFVNLPDDAIVFNHRQTEGIIRGQAGYRGKALVNGNVSGPAYASGTSAAIQKLEEAKAMWQAIANMDVESLLGAASGGGGGGGDNSVKAHIEDLEEWYNLLRQIENLEQKISNIQAERANIDDGHEYLRSLREEQALLEKQVTTQEILLNYQQKQLKLQADQINQNKIWSQFLTVGEDGLLQYKKGNEANGGKGALEVLQDLNQMSGKEQQAFMKQIGYSYTDTDGNKLKGEELVAKFYEELQAQIDAYDELYDTVNETEETLEGLETSIRDVDKEILENQMTLETAVYEALVSMREKEIEQLEEQVDLIKEANKAYIDGIQEAIQAERDMYEKNEAVSDREQLQRRLALLKMAGGSASEIADLEAQLDETLKNEYFSRQEESLDAIRDASDKQIERLDNQIRIMEENLAYQKENGILWQKVYDVMAGGEGSILTFISEGNTAFFEASALEQKKMLDEWAKQIGIYKEDQAYKNNTEKGYSIWNEKYRADNPTLSGLTKDQHTKVSDEFASAYAKHIGAGMTEKEATKAAWEDVQQTISNFKSENEKPKEEPKKDNSSENKKKETTKYKKVYITVKAGNLGGTPSPSQSTVEPNKSFTINAGAWTGYEFSHITYNGVEKKSKTITPTGKVQNIEILVYYKNIAGKIDKAIQDKLNNTPSNQPGYSEGGIIDYTGTAMVHGTPSKPEAVLNPKQTEAFMSLVENYRKLAKFENPLVSYMNAYGARVGANIAGAHNNDNSNNVTVAPGAVQIAVAQLNDKYDVEELANDVMNRMVVIANKATNRGVNRR